MDNTQDDYKISPPPSHSPLPHTTNPSAPSAPAPATVATVVVAALAAAASAWKSG